MREAYGGMWLFMIVIFFLSVFSSYLAVSINYSRSFKVKDEIVDIIEKNRGIVNVYGSSTGAISEIKAYLADVGYRTQGSCDEGFTGYDLTSGESENSASPVFCVREYDATTIKPHTATNAGNKAHEFIRSKYYRVQVFFRLEIPIFDQAFGFSVYGTTKIIYMTSK